MRNVVSRVTMGVVGVVLIYAAYKCVWASGMLDRAYEQANATGYQRGRVAALPLMVGVGLALLGAALSVCAVVPTSFLERFNAPPGDPREEAEGLARRMRGRYR